MATKSFLQPLVAGVAGGALLTMVLGFTVGGWVTGSKAENTARDQSNNAVVAALAPLCLRNFKGSADAKEQHVLLKKADEWKHAEFVKSGGWAVMPGMPTVSTALASSCAKLILAA